MNNGKQIKRFKEYLKSKEPRVIHPNSIIGAIISREQHEVKYQTEPTITLQDIIEWKKQLDASPIPAMKETEYGLALRFWSGGAVKQ